MTNSATNQVLVTKGNQPLLAVGKTLDDLLPGQLGIFDADTGQVVKDPAKANRLLIAVGVNSKEVRFQGGECIQKKNLLHRTFTPASASKGQIFTITGIKANCDSSYVLKIGFSSPALMELNGYNSVSKIYSVKTSCCEPCATGCNEGSCIELVSKLGKAISEDTEGLFTVSYIDDKAADIADFTAWVADPANATKCPGLKITSIPQNVSSYCGLNFNYDKVRDVIIHPFLTDGFTCSGQITETQKAVGETGNAYDLKQLEEIASGYNNGSSPYRMLPNGIQKQHITLVDSTSRYDYFWLAYFYKIESGSGRNFENPIQTLIAIPETDTVTRDAFAAATDLLFADTEILASYAAAASATATVVEPAITDSDTDGIV